MRRSAVLVCALAIACNPPDQAADTSAAVPADTTPPAPAPLLPDVYTTRIAIFVKADTLTTEERKGLTEEDLQTIGDDGNWYRSEAWTLLDSLGIKYTSSERKPMRFLVNGSVKEYNWNDLKHEFIVLYDGKKEPRAVAPVEIHDHISYIVQ